MATRTKRASAAALEATLRLYRDERQAVNQIPTLRMLLAELPEIERRPQACASLRKLLATGEAFPVSLKERLWQALPDLELYTSYAQTEGGLIASLRPEEQRERPESVLHHLAGRAPRRPEHLASDTVRRCESDL